MEEILSSIKRIIAEEGDATQTRTRRPVRPATTVAPAAGSADDDDEILELNDRLAESAPITDPELDTPVKMSKTPSTPSPQTPPTPAAEPILSQHTAAVSRGSLETLSKLLTRPEPGSDGTLEGLVRELLRPMLREWLDANLPELVETMVAREIEKITGQQR